MFKEHINLKQFFNARKFSAKYIKYTPIIHSLPLSAEINSYFYFKCEMLQPTGAFKVRGAANKLLSLSPKKIKNVIAVSTGNHGCAVAYMAKELGFNAYIYVSNNVPPNKLNNIKQYGAKIIVTGNSQDEAEVQARKAAQADDAELIHPFDDLSIIQGQGTMALDLIEQVPDISYVLVPLSGGGLISGVASALKQLDRSIKVIGISMDQGAAMYQSIQRSKPTDIEEIPSYADSLQGGIGLHNQYTFDYTREYVDDYILVTEAEILNAMTYILQHHKLLVEGAAAVGTAAVLSGKLPYLDGPTVSLLTGNNVSTDIIQQMGDLS